MYTEEQRTEIIQKYIDEMEIIKLRTTQIQDTSVFLGFLQPMVEYKALQLRKIIEQILLASLIANKEEYQKYYNRLGTEWNARLISRDLKRVNPDFFPKQVIDDHEHHEINTVKDSPTCEEIITIYEKLGKHLHASNPYAAAIDYIEIDHYLDKAIQRIKKLLTTHTISASVS